ncbi:MAG: hypothetical protein QOJ38_1517 [Solirubrobacterales bacterium]|jgi:hypothetical protein|nr:hypothetical protein [Solirubrobacterales bacterium]
MRHPVDVARATAGLQAQEPRAGRLAFRSRSPNLTAADVDRARVEERSLLRMWAMRTTIHIVPAEDVDLFLAVYRPSILELARTRLATKLGIEPRAQEKALRLIQGSLEAEGPMTRKQIGERLRSAGIIADDHPRYWLLMAATMERIACLGPDRGSEACFVLASDWLGKPRRIDRDVALAELARRYVGAFGPASAQDFASWSGLSVAECRRALASISRELVEQPSPKGALVLRSGGARPPSRKIVRLLPAFDTYLLGYSSRNSAVEPGEGRQIFRGGGVLRPTICVDGRLVGMWGSKRSGSRLRVSLEPFSEFDEKLLPEIEAEVADIGRFEGLSAVLEAI